MKYISKMLPACGFVIAVALVGITSSFKDAQTNTSSKLTEYYFAYNAPTGSEDIESNWIPIDQLQYDNAGCDGDAEGCVLRTTSITVVGTTTQPSKVNVDVNDDGQLIPITGDGVDEVHNKISTP